MKFICLQENLKKGLARLERIITPNLTLPILSNVLIAAEKNGLQMSATNLEIGIKTWVPAKVEETGKVAVAVRLLAGFVANLPAKQIKAELKAKKAVFTAGSYQAGLSTLPTGDFPIIPQVKDSQEHKVSADNLFLGLEQIGGFSAPLDSGRVEISGVLFDFKGKQLVLAATDSFRLVERKINLKAETGVSAGLIIPQRTAQELQRLLAQEPIDDLGFSFDNNQIVFKVGQTEMVSRLIEGKYPDYSQIIPPSFKTSALVGVLDFIKAIKIIALFAGRNNDVLLKTDRSKNQIKVSSQDACLGNAKTSFPAKIDGPDLEMIFNFRYLLSVLEAIKEDQAQLCLNNNNSPALLRPAKAKNFLALVMPIKG